MKIIQPSTGSGSGAPVGASYFVVALDATLTNERALSFNATNFSTTDLGAGNTYSVNTSQDIATTASPTFVAPSVQRLIISGSTSSNFINASGTLDNATGDEIAYQFNYTTNKATSGTDTGFYLNQTDTASPGISYLMNLARNGGSVFNIDNLGNLATSATVWTLATITSFTMQDILARPLIYADAVSLQLKTNPVYVSPAASTSGTPQPSLTTTVPAHTNITASTEAPDMLIDMSSTKTWLAGTLANQRSLRILAPTLSLPGGSTCTEASTISISGPPNLGTGSGITLSIGFKLETRALNSLIGTGLGFQVYAPTGAVTNACGSFLNGNVGIGGSTGAAVSPKTWLHVQIDDNITAAQNAVVCVDGTTRYVGTYFGGTIISAPASNTSVVSQDFGWTPSANSGFNVGVNQSFFTLAGSVNTTGNLRGIQNVMFFNTTSPAVATQINGIVSAIQSTTGISTGAVTTARGFQASTSFAGTGNCATYISYDASFSIAGANTTTDWLGVRINNPSITTGAVTNVTQISLEDITATVGTLKIGVRQKGTNAHNRFTGNVSFGQDATPGATVDVAGRLFIDGPTGLITKYDNLTLVGRGVPYQTGTQDLTAQVAAKAATTIFTPTQTGWFRINIYLQITTAATTSSVLGGATGVVITYNDGDGNVAQTRTAALQTNAGAIAVTSATNTTATSLEGVMVIYARTGVAIQYAIGYTSVGITAMQYAAHLRAEAL